MAYSDYKIHPLADAFPLMEGKDFDELVESIGGTGLIEPIVMDGGVVIDGRNRLRACEKAGVEPRFEEYDSTFAIADYIWAKNYTRRMMTDDQKAVVVLAWEEEVREQNRIKHVEGSRLGGSNSKAVNKCSQPSPRGSTRKDLAEKAEVSERKIYEAQTVNRYDKEHGTNFVEGIRAGTVKLRDAYKQAKGGDIAAKPTLSTIEKVAKIREMAADGYRADQIANELALKAETIRLRAREHGIELPDERLGKSKKIDAARIVGETVSQADAVASGLDLVESYLSSVEKADLAEWIDSLGDSISRLRKLLRAMREAHDAANSEEVQG